MWHACVAGPVTSTRQRHSIKIIPLEFIGRHDSRLWWPSVGEEWLWGEMCGLALSIGVGCDTLGACMSRLGVGVNYFAGGCHIAHRTQGQSDVKC